MKYHLTQEEKIEFSQAVIEMLDLSETLSDAAKLDEKLVYECPDSSRKPEYLNKFLENAEINRNKMARFKEILDKISDAYYKPGLIYMGFHSRLTCLHIEKAKEQRIEEVKKIERVEAGETAIDKEIRELKMKLAQIKLF